jgi:hypothetical protein
LSDERHIFTTIETVDEKIMEFGKEERGTV